MSCGVGCRCSSDLTPLAWELPCAAGVALKRKKEKKKKRKRKEKKEIRTNLSKALGTKDCPEEPIRRSSEGTRWQITVD